MLINALNPSELADRLPSPQTLDSALAIMRREVSDPQLRDMTEREMRKLYAIDETIAKERRERVLVQAANELATAGKIGDETAKLLSMSDYRDLTEKERNYSSPITMAMLAVSDGVPRDAKGNQLRDANGNLVSMRDFLIDQYQHHNLSHSDFVAQMTKLNSRNAEYAYANDEAIRTFLINNGMGDMLKTGTNNEEAATQLLLFKSAVEKELRRAQRGDQRITPEMEKEVMQKVLTDTVFKDVWGRDPRMMVGVIPEKDLEKAYVMVGAEQVYVSKIDRAVREEIIAGLNQIGEPATEQRIAEEWIAHGKPKKIK